MCGGSTFKYSSSTYSKDEIKPGEVLHIIIRMTHYELAIIKLDDLAHSSSLYITCPQLKKVAIFASLHLPTHLLLRVGFESK